MTRASTALERAFQFAKSGHVLSVADIKFALRSGGYSTARVEGLTLIPAIEGAHLNRSAQTGRQSPGRGPLLQPTPTGNGRDPIVDLIQPGSVSVELFCPHFGGAPIRTDVAGAASATSPPLPSR